MLAGRFELEKLLWIFRSTQVLHRKLGVIVTLNTRDRVRHDWHILDLLVLEATKSGCCPYVEKGEVSFEDWCFHHVSNFEGSRSNVRVNV